MKNYLFTLLIFIMSLSAFAQSQNNISHNDRLLDLFNYFYESSNLHESIILDHGVDLNFLKNQSNSKFKVIAKNEADNYNSYLLFHTLDIQENVGRVRYAVVNRGKKEMFQTIFFDMNNFKVIKK